MVKCMLTWLWWEIRILYCTAKGRLLVGDEEWERMLTQVKRKREWERVNGGH